MREINRSRYLRGTRAWTIRNWFVFGGLTVTLLMGAASVFMLPGLKKSLQQKVEEERAAKMAKRELLAAIQKHREELELGKYD